ncbi:MAG: hypothetical protein ACRD01_05660 [Terriglobales bacterium]
MSVRNARLTSGLRLLQGAIFVVIGVNGFHPYLPQPNSVPPAALAFAGAMAQTGYFLQLLFGVQVAAGILLLADRWVPLALTLLAPVIVNIILFHSFLWRGGTLAAGILVLALEIYLAWAYWESFRPLLAQRARPR